VIARIYGLHGSDGVVRYVGKTTTELVYRLRSHRSGARKPRKMTPVVAWMREIGLDNLGIKELEVCVPADLAEREAYWILKLGTLVEQGGLNVWLGSKMTDELRQRVIDGMTPDGKERIAASKRELYADPTEREVARERAAQQWSDADARARAADHARQGHAKPGRREISQRAGRKSMHIRHHVDRGLVKDGCEFCGGEL
jgi:hypothetical protein